MKSLIKLFYIGAVLGSLSIATAQAEIFHIEDKDNGYSITFPDTWKIVTNRKPDDKITVAAPGPYQFAQCRLRMREDRRFVIFPGQFDNAIQKIAFSRKFWDDYLGEYNNVTVDAFKDSSGLGQGHASMAEVSFETAENPIVKKRGVMFVSLYHDRLFIVDCSSEESVYHEWRQPFLSIIKSVDFSPLRHDQRFGHYREMEETDALEVEGPRERDIFKF